MFTVRIETTRDMKHALNIANGFKEGIMSTNEIMHNDNQEGQYDDSEVTVQDEEEFIEEEEITK